MKKIKQTVLQHLILWYFTVIMIFKWLDSFNFGVLSKDWNQLKKSLKSSESLVMMFDHRLFLELLSCTT